MDRDIEDRLQRLERIAHAMERMLPIPGTDIRIGVESALGVVPVVGDALGLLPAGYIIHHSHKLGAPRRLLYRQGLNVALDLIIGLVPVLGDIFDIGWQANTRNVRLLRAHLQTQTAHADGARAVTQCDLSGDPAAV